MIQVDTCIHILYTITLIRIQINKISRVTYLMYEFSQLKRGPVGRQFGIVGSGIRMSGYMGAGKEPDASYLVSDMTLCQHLASACCAVGWGGLF